MVGWNYGLFVFLNDNFGYSIVRIGGKEKLI